LKSVKVSKQAVDDYLVKHPVMKAKIMEKASRNYTSPFLAYKTLKK